MQYSTLNSGYKIPRIGLGTYQIKQTEAKQAIIDAIDVGYRHLDLAEMYDNQSQVGEAFREVFASGKVKREDLWITSKLWNTDHHPEHVEAACLKTLNDLQVIKYLDLYLMHWPLCFIHDGKSYFPRDSEGRIIYDPNPVPLSVTWEAMEQLVDKGLVHSIGVSNVPESLLNDLWSTARIKPAVNQIELHIFLQQPRLINFCANLGVHVTAYVPIARAGQGTIARQGSEQQEGDRDRVNIYKNSTIIRIAQKYKKTEVQIALRFLMQWGKGENISAIPKTVHKERMAENFNIFDFELDEQDMKDLEQVDENARLSSGIIKFGIKGFD
ncbi:MAG: alcohol dehydrogenase (NADP+) [Streblomastix strix]|uniref:Alcohol dehydrogenase (NADP+) n=1 Tax=Streblomastix strix TaxID=222440 RepID=A0A5J4W1S0_9EUKA|nr:MAG: alcohol dehydrogenase (NADP+) [Streblomastix strix]